MLIPIIGFSRDESIVKTGSETIFASYFGSHAGFGKDSLDVEFNGVKKTKKGTVRLGSGRASGLF